MFIENTISVHTEQPERSGKNIHEKAADHKRMANIIEVNGYVNKCSWPPKGVKPCSNVTFVFVSNVTNWVYGNK